MVRCIFFKPCFLEISIYSDESVRELRLDLSSVLRLSIDQHLITWADINLLICVNRNKLMYNIQASACFVFEKTDRGIFSLL